MVALLGKQAERRLPDDPDKIPEPKDLLLELARRAPLDVRLDLRAEAGAIAGQGLGYNHRLRDLVSSLGRPDRAAERSPSLRRAIARIGELTNADKR